MNCSCFPCRAQRVVRTWARRVALGVATIALVGSGLVVSVQAADRAMNPPERDVWFARLIDLAVRADVEYDAITETWADVSPKSWDEVYPLVDEIINQISEEGASPQIIPPTELMFTDFGPGTRSAVAGMYFENDGSILLNDRYLTRAWHGQSWLSTLVHELVHAQGYFVGESSTLEAQTEIVATEVLAAMANLDYPGARADLLDSLRRDALSMAFYIAQFGGSPIHSTYVNPPLAGLPDQDMLDRLAVARAAVFTPTELARAEHRLRWWMESAEEYEGVLARYIVKTTTIEIDAACSESETVREPFQRYSMTGLVQRYNPEGLFPTWSKTAWAVQPLRVDDLAFVLKNELGFCS